MAGQEISADEKTSNGADAFGSSHTNCGRLAKCFSLMHGAAPKVPPAADQCQIGHELQMNCSPCLDHAAGLFPVSFSQGGPCATDRPISSIGALLPIAL